LLSATKPDIVWAFVENNRHKDIVEICAPKGIHVVFEKPLASTLEDARAIQKLAKKHNIHILVNYQMAWWPTSYAAYEAVQAGKIGEAWRMRGIVGHGGPGGGNMKQDPAKNKSAVFYEWLNDEEKNGGGAIMDFGCYNALWALWYLGKPESIYAFTHTRKPQNYDVDDNAFIVAKYPRGEAIMEGSWSLPRSFQDVEILGTSGSVFATRRAAELTPSGRNSKTELLDAPELPANRASAIAYMIDCIKTGKQLEGMVALDINVDVVEIIEAARQSVKSGEVVKLPMK